MIIVDEAGKFKPKFLEYMHELRDNTEHTTGIVFAGPQYFKDNIEKWKNRGVQGVPELYRRMNHWETLEPPTQQEVRAFCINSGIDDRQFISELFKTAENFADIQDRIVEQLRIMAE